MKWFPVWGHAICCVMMIAIHNWLAAWYAAAATYFAFVWIAGNPNADAVGRRGSDVPTSGLLADGSKGETR